MVYASVIFGDFVDPVLYTMDGCLSCFKAKQHLIQNNIYFIEKDLFTDLNAALEIKDLLGEVTAPVFVDGAFILKGSDILRIDRKRVGTSKKHQVIIDEPAQ